MKIIAFLVQMPIVEPLGIIKKLTYQILVLASIFFFSACGQKTENKILVKNDSAAQSSDLKNTENRKAKTNEIESIKTDEQKPSKKLQFSNGPSREKIHLNIKTVIIIQYDSIEIEQLKTIDGKDIFYTAVDDLMWYNSIMTDKMDSLGIPIKYTEKDTIDFFSKNYKRTIVKDSTFSIYSYFLFNGENITRTDLFSLIEE